MFQASWGRCGTSNSRNKINPTTLHPFLAHPCSVVRPSAIRDCVGEGGRRLGGGGSSNPGGNLQREERWWRAAASRLTAWRWGLPSSTSSKNFELTLDPPPLFVRIFSTGHPFMACTWFGEFCSCCCLPLPPQLACKILATMYKQ